MVSARFSFIGLHGPWAEGQCVDGDAHIYVFDGGLMGFNRWWLNDDKCGLKVFYHLVN